MGHTAPKHPAPFPVDECRRVLMEVDVRASGWDLATAKLTEELRLAALRDAFRGDAERPS